MTNYQILGVSKGATLVEIKKAYKALAKKHHPDSKVAPNKVLFQKIVNAYAILSESTARYSSTGTRPPKFNKDASVSFKTASAGIPENVWCQCTLKQMVDRGFFTVGNIQLPFPELYTRSAVYEVMGEELVVNFEVTDFSYDIFTFVPDLDGVCCTIATDHEVEMEDGMTPTIPVPHPTGTSYLKIQPDIVDKKEQVLIYYNIGIPFMQPFTGQVMKGLLLIPYKKKINDKKTKISSGNPNAYV